VDDLISRAASARYRNKSDLKGRGFSRAANTPEETLWLLQNRDIHSKKFPQTGT
jgi:hypothetical protein